MKVKVGERYKFISESIVIAEIKEDYESNSEDSFTSATLLQNDKRIFMIDRFKKFDFLVDSIWQKLKNQDAIQDI